MDVAQLDKGAEVLVRGAIRGVGVVAVQLAAALGARVAALAGADNLSWVRDLGAHQALVYRTTSPSTLARTT